MVFAKSTPIDNPETLLYHTNEVLRELECLKNSYGEKILESVPDQYKQYFWNAVSLACKAHDLGKVQLLFQNKILKVCKRQPLQPIKGIKDIPHNIISPAFIHNHVKIFPKEIRPAIYQAIAFHHARGKDLLEDKEWLSVHNAIKNDIAYRMSELHDMQSMFNHALLPPSADYLRKLQEPLSGDEATFYLLLKGILHRSDHSGSAHMPSEVSPRKHSSHQITDYLSKRPGMSDIWQLNYTDTTSDHNIVFQAGTGSGKTEFALYWIGSDKAFYTLPMRTSVNAMYERLKETYNSDNIGLLHSDSALHVLSEYDHEGITDNDGMTEALRRIDISRQLSMPISVSTADQIFTATFKYEGYEKVFATLAYSKIVIDEIQSYDPDIVAIILKTLVDVSRLGGKFCVITATLPRMYLDYLKENVPGIPDTPPRFRTSPRHRIRHLSKPIDDPEVIDRISRLNKKHGGVLVISNTVKMAKRIKALLADRGVQASLLHSMFTYEDRNFKENDRHQGILHNQKGIWITTQIAEVSLNIDFDVLITEVSSIDSQIQRWGRVWRLRSQEYHHNDPNIYITPTPSDNGHIYNEDLVNLTLRELQHCNDSLLSDMKENELVQKVFSDPALADSKYKSKFDASLRMLEEYGFAVNTKGEAQRLFRHISNVTIIPSEVYDENKKEIDEATVNIEARDRETKLKALLTTRKKSVSVPYHYLREIKYWFLNSKYDLIVAEMKYNAETGIELEPTLSAAFL